MDLADIGSWMVIIGIFAELPDLLVKIEEAKKHWPEIKEWLKRILKKAPSATTDDALLIHVEESWKTVSGHPTARVSLNVCAAIIQWCKKFQLLMNIWELGWWIVIVLGLVIELGANQRARRIDSRDNAALHVQAGNAEKEAGIANKLAGEAHERAEMASERAEKEALARVELESDLAAMLSPRRLVRASEAVARLAQINSNTTAVVRISANTGPGGDASAVASQVAEFIRAAHWNLISTNVPDDWIWPTLNGPVEVQVNERFVRFNEGSKEEVALTVGAMRAGKALAKELNDGGLDAEAVLSRMHLPAGIVVVVIGDRANPFENRLLEQKLEQRAILWQKSDPEAAKRIKGIADSLEESDRWQRVTPRLRAVREKYDMLGEEEGKILRRIIEIQSKRFAPSSKEFKEAQTEYNGLAERLSQLDREQESLREQERILMWGTNVLSIPGKPH